MVSLVTLKGKKLSYDTLMSYNRINSGQTEAIWSQFVVFWCNTELKTAAVLKKKKITNIIKYLKIVKFSEYESFIDSIDEKTPRALLKYN